MGTYKARLIREAGGSWLASAVALPHCWSRGATRDEALAKLRDEIRYRIEFCPCSGVDEEFVRVEVQVQEPASAARSQPGTIASERTRSRGAAELSGAAGCPPAPDPPSEVRPMAARPAGWRRWDD